MTSGGVPEELVASGFSGEELAFCVVLYRYWLFALPPNKTWCDERKKTAIFLFWRPQNAGFSLGNFIANQGRRRFFFLGRREQTNAHEKWHFRNGFISALKSGHPRRVSRQPTAISRPSHVDPTAIPGSAIPLLGVPPRRARVRARRRQANPISRYFVRRMAHSAAMAPHAPSGARCDSAAHRPTRHPAAAPSLVRETKFLSTLAHTTRVRYEGGAAA